LSGCLTRLDPAQGAGQRNVRWCELGVVVGTGLAVYFGAAYSISALAQDARTSAEIPRSHRFIVKARMKVQEGDTVSSLLTALDFAKPGDPTGRIDAVQLAEIAAMTTPDALTAGELLFVNAVTEGGVGRHLMMYFSLSSSNGRMKFYIRLNDDGTYTKYYGPTP